MSTFKRIALLAACSVAAYVLFISIVAAAMFYTAGPRIAAAAIYLESVR